MESGQGPGPGGGEGGHNPDRVLVRQRTLLPADATLPGPAEVDGGGDGHDIGLSQLGGGLDEGGCRVGGQVRGRVGWVSCSCSITNI